MAENWWLIIVVLLVIGIGLWWLVGRSDKPAAPPVDRKVEERPAAPPPAALVREPEPVVLSPKVADVPPAPVAAPVAKPVAAPKTKAKATAPVAKAAPAAKATPKKAATPKAAPVAKAAPKKAAPAAKAATSKAAPKPKAKPSVPDDLLLVKGIGPKVAALLAGEGVTRFEQIAAWGDTDIAAIDDKLGTFRGRPTRDKWVEQAGYLARGDRAGFESKFGKLEG